MIFTTLGGMRLPLSAAQNRSTSAGASRMFSGLRSQWTTRAQSKATKPATICIAKRRTDASGRPRNWFCFKSSYRFIESSSKTKQTCDKCVKSPKRWTMCGDRWFAFSARAICDSIKACCEYEAQFFTTLMATSRPVLRDRHRKTWPKDPDPRRSTISKDGPSPAPGWQPSVSPAKQMSSFSRLSWRLFRTPSCGYVSGLRGTRPRRYASNCASSSAEARPAIFA
mmetsp:Transcript_11203/g.37367  ORF Transcript_11203/g.37367 Transcript_11203/m.37367 type:complete len:225 (+) Transcript_11203:500-1174(+)